MVKDKGTPKIPRHQGETKLNQATNARQAICDAGMNWTLAKVPKEGEQGPDPQKSNWLVREDLWTQRTAVKHAKDYSTRLAMTMLSCKTLMLLHFSTPLLHRCYLLRQRRFFDAGKHIWLTARVPETLRSCPGTVLAASYSFPIHMSNATNTL